MKGLPIVVCIFSGRSEDSGAVSTANYVARALGVKSGIPISQAKRILKGREDATFLPADKQYYTALSERIMEILRNNSDMFEQTGIDEAFLEVTFRTNGDYEEAEKHARDIKKSILSQEGITSSIGVAPNKVVAKIASDHVKPDGLTVIKPHEVLLFLHPLLVGKLYGVGKKTEEKLQGIGVRTIGDLAKLDLERLSSLLGRKLATYLHLASNGVDDEPVQAKGEKAQIGRIATLKENTRDMKKIMEALDVLITDVHSKLSHEGLAFRSVSLMAIMKDLKIFTRSKTLESSSSSSDTIRSTLWDLLGKLLEEEKELDLRRVGVVVSNLSKGGGQMLLSEFTSGQNP